MSSPEDWQLINIQHSFQAASGPKNKARNCLHAAMTHLTWGLEDAGCKKKKKKKQCFFQLLVIFGLVLVMPWLHTIQEIMSSNILQFFFIFSSLLFQFVVVLSKNKKRNTKENHSIPIHYIYIKHFTRIKMYKG